MSWDDDDDYDDDEQDATNSISLLIAIRRHKNPQMRVLEVFTDRDKALKEAIRLIVSTEKDNELIDYTRKRDVYRAVLSKPYLDAEKRSVLPHLIYEHLSPTDSKKVDAEIERQLGEAPQHIDTDEFTVVSLPIGKRGSWELP